jgi:hypothetical protein
MGLIMIRRKHLYPAAMALFVLMAAPARADIRDNIVRATQNLKDITVVCKVGYADLKELRKIGDDFSRSYEIKRTTVRFKSPDKLRIDGKLGLIKMAMIINGDQKGFHFPIRGWQRENIKDEPHKRQSDLDIGVVSETLWKDYIVLDADKEKGADGPVYRIVFARENARKKKHICWVDTETCKLLKLQRLESDGSVIATYVYSGHKCVDGIWVPTRTDVYNGDGKLGGTTFYENIRVNTGIPDSQFKM